MSVLTNSKHEIVAQLVATGKSWEAAMVEAGYSKKTARHNMGLLRANVGIQARIAEFHAAMASAKLVSAAKLHERWSEMFEADIADIMLTGPCVCTEIERPKCLKCAGSGLAPAGYKPVHLWPKIWRQMLSGMDVKELYEHSTDGGGASWDKIGEVVKVKFMQQKDLGELLGKHKAVDAFVSTKTEEHLHLHVHAELNNRIAAGRQRAAQRNNAGISETTTIPG